MPPEGCFDNNGRGILTNILSNHHLGISIYFRGQANEVVAEAGEIDLSTKSGKLA